MASGEEAGGPRSSLSSASYIVWCFLSVTTTCGDDPPFWGVEFGPPGGAPGGRT